MPNLTMTNDHQVAAGRLTRSGWMLLGSATLALTLGASSALAQDQAATDSTRLEEIVVTAQKREQNVQDAPLTITAVSGEALVDVGITTVQELNRIDPALQIGHATGTVTTFIRGIGNPVTTAGNEASVPVYIDDVYFTRASVPFFDLSSIERVEVLKGPQGTLFGRNASGGVISIFTKDPGQDAEVDMRLGYANYDTVDAKLYANAPISDRVAANISLSYHDQNDGWGLKKTLADSADTSKGYKPGGTDYWFGDSFSARAKLLIEPGDTTKIKLVGYYQDSYNTIGIYARPFPGTEGGTPDAAHNGFPVPATGVFGPYPTPSQALPKLGFYDVVGQTSDMFDESEGYGFSARIDQEFGFADFVSITAYRHNDELYHSWGNYSSYDWLQYELNIVDKQFSQEFQLKSPADSPFPWIIGAYYLNADGGFSPTTIHGEGAAAAGLDGVDIFGQQKVKSYAGFAQASYPVTEMTNITVGLRYTKDKVNGVGRTDTRFLPGVGTGIGLPSDTLVGPTYTDSESFSKVTWNGSIDHKISDDMMVYASIRRGYKAGTFNTLPLDSAALNPEVIDTYEVGMKSELADGRVRLNGAVFWNDIKNPQVQAQRNGLVFLKNAGSARTKGAEFDLTALAAEGLTFRLAATYLDAKFRSFPDAPAYATFQQCQAPTSAAMAAGCAAVPPAPGNLNVYQVDAKGNGMPYASKFKLSTSVSYEWMMENMGEFSFDLSGNYQSKFNWDADNIIKEPSRFLVDTSLAFSPQAMDNLTLRLWVKNVTKEKWNLNFYSQASGSAFSSAPGAPRTYGAEVQVKF